MKFLDLGGGQPTGEYAIGFVRTEDEDAGWVSLNKSKLANPTFVGCAGNMEMFEDNTFDHVRAIHFPSSSLNVNVLLEIRRVLKPRGHVFIRTGRDILDNINFARGFMAIFRATLISGHSDYLGVKPSP